MGLKLHCCVSDCQYETDEVPEFNDAIRLLTLHMKYVHPTNVATSPSTSACLTKNQVTAELADNKLAKDLEHIATGVTSSDLSIRNNHRPNRVSHSTPERHHQRIKTEDSYLDHDTRHLQASTSKEKRNTVWVQCSEYGVYDVAGKTNCNYDLRGHASIPKHGQGLQGNSMRTIKGPDEFGRFFRRCF